jgi:hypothetical protein
MVSQKKSLLKKYLVLCPYLTNVDGTVGWDERLLGLVEAYTKLEWQFRARM